MGEVFPGFQDTALLADSLLVVLAVFGTAFLTFTCLTPLIISIAPRLGLIDNPGPRAIHSRPTARAGGIAIFIALHLSILVLLNSPIRRFGVLNLWDWWFTFAIASLAIFTVGIIDDLKRLSAPSKLAGQILASFLVYMSDIRIQNILGYALPEPLGFLITVAWFVIITNAFNLVDGLDGLATGLTGLASLGLAGSLILRGIYVEAVILIGFIGALLGFLRFNVSPAKIFLGDSGSNLCGFTLAYIMLTTGSKHLAFAQQWVVMLILIVPLADTILAIWRRSVNYLLSRSTGAPRKSGVMTGDLEHLHHRLKGLGLNNRDVVAVLFLVNAIFVLASLISLPIPHYSVAVVGITALVFAAAILTFLPPRELRQSAYLIYVLMIRPRSPILGKFLRLLVDAAVAAMALLVAFILCHPEASLTTIGWFWREIGPSWIVSALAISILLVNEHNQIKLGRPIFKVLLASLAVTLLVLNISLVLPVKSWQSLAVELSMFAILAMLFLASKQLVLRGIQRFIESPKQEQTRN